MKISEIPITEGSAVIIRRPKWDDDKMITLQDGQLLNVIINRKSHAANDRVGLDSAWLKLDDFEIVEHLIAPPAEGTLKRSEIEVRGWTAKMITDCLGECHHKIEVDSPYRSRKPMQASVWLLQDVLDAEEREEVAIKISKTLKARAERESTKADRLAAKKEAERVALYEAVESLKDIAYTEKGVVVLVHDVINIIEVRARKLDAALDIFHQHKFFFKNGSWQKQIQVDNVDQIRQAISDIRLAYAKDLDARQMLLNFAREQFPIVEMELASPYYRLFLKEDWIEIAFEYNERAVYLVKQIEGRKYDSARKTWLVPFTQLPHIRQILPRIHSVFENIDLAKRNEMQAFIASEAERQRQKAMLGICTGTAWGATRHAPVQEGQIMWRKGSDGVQEIVKVIRVGQPHFCREPLSFGSPDEDMAWYTPYEYILANEEESAPLLEQKANAERQRAAIVELDTIHERLMLEGEAVWGENKSQIALAGEKIDLPHSPQNLYGGGRWFVCDGDFIWAVTNNGADGDFWPINNIQTAGAGAVGRRAPFDADLWHQIVTANQTYFGTSNLYLEM